MQLHVLANPKFISTISKLLDADVGFQAARKLHSLKKQMESELSVFEAERKKIIEACCNRDENNEPIIQQNDKGEGMYTFSQEQGQKLNDSINALMNAEIAIEKVVVVIPPKFEIAISANDLGLLDSVIDFQ